MLLDKVRELLSMDVNELARKIDHTLLKPTASFKDIERICNEAIKYNFIACYVSPCYVEYAYKMLKGSEVKLGSVIAFPHGNTSIDCKVNEAKWLVEHNVDEVDMVINLGAVKSGNFKIIEEEVSRVAEVVHEYGAILKVIIESGLLTNEEKIEVVRVLIKAKADFVKTSTGFIGPGANIHDVYFLKRVSNGKLKVKAAGGIRHALDALMLIAVGADRIGTSTGVQIIEEFKFMKKLI